LEKLELKCVWVSSGDSKGCQEILDSCSDVTSNKEWCETSGAVKTTETPVETIECTWIYSSSSGDGDGDSGTCYSKDDTTLTCDKIYENDQCMKGGGIGSINNKCDMYGGLCKTKCRELGAGTACTSGDRGSECFLIRNGDGSFNSCTVIVYLFIFIFIFIFLFFFNFNFPFFFFFFFLCMYL
jgi:hypothetical protein